MIEDIKIITGIPEVHDKPGFNFAEFTLTVDTKVYKTNLLEVGEYRLDVMSDSVPSFTFDDGAGYMINCVLQTNDPNAWVPRELLQKDCMLVKKTIEVSEWKPGSWVDPRFALYEQKQKDLFNKNTKTLDEFKKELKDTPTEDFEVRVDWELRAGEFMNMHTRAIRDKASLDVFIRDIKEIFKDGNPTTTDELNLAQEKKNAESDKPGIKSEPFEIIIDKPWMKEMDLTIKDVMKDGEIIVVEPYDPEDDVELTTFQKICNFPGKWWFRLRNGYHRCSSEHLIKLYDEDETTKANSEAMGKYFCSTDRYEGLPVLKPVKEDGSLDYERLFKKSKLFVDQDVILGESIVEIPAKVIPLPELADTNPLKGETKEETREEKRKRIIDKKLKDERNGKL